MTLWNRPPSGRLVVHLYPDPARLPRVISRGDRGAGCARCPALPRSTGAVPSLLGTEELVDRHVPEPSYRQGAGTMLCNYFVDGRKRYDDRLA
jgi:hypothetical protein